MRMFMHLVVANYNLAISMNIDIIDYVVYNIYGTNNQCMANSEKVANTELHA